MFYVHLFDFIKKIDFLISEKLHHAWNHDIDTGSFQKNTLLIIEKTLKFILCDPTQIWIFIKNYNKKKLFMVQYRWPYPLTCDWMFEWRSHLANWRGRHIDNSFRLPIKWMMEYLDDFYFHAINLPSMNLSSNRWEDPKKQKH